MVELKSSTVSKKLGNEQAFTLIEVISVLVILGILAAVAVPKYTDMQQTARNKAAASAIAECKARASALYARFLLENNGVVTDISGQAIMDDIDTDYGDFTVTNTANGNNIDIEVTEVQGAATNGSNTGVWFSPSR